jgi:hypothetical protein
LVAFGESERKERESFNPPKKHLLPSGRISPEAGSYQNPVSIYSTTHLNPVVSSVGKYQFNYLLH